MSAQEHIIHAVYVACIRSWQTPEWVYGVSTRFARPMRMQWKGPTLPVSIVDGSPFDARALERLPPAGYRYPDGYEL